MSEQSQGPGWWRASDGKWYPPDPQHQPPPPTKNKRGCLWWIGAGVVAIVVLSVIAAIAGGSDDDGDTRTQSFATTTEPDTPTTADPFAGETESQTQARRKAADYLDVSAFSRAGLIKQLEFEGFSTADATYGVDALNVDWKAQAAEKAAQYLEMSSFSRSGLVDQLEFEGFTPEEAEYGASTTGL